MVKKERDGIYKQVTDRIVEQLKNGVVPWKQPWKNEGFGVFPRNAVSGREYNGVNVLFLWSIAMEKGYSNPRWLTFKQVKEAGGRVRKGEKATEIVFLSNIEVTEENQDGKKEKKRVSFLRWYYVFNVAQCENLPARLLGEEKKPKTVKERIDAAEAFIKNTDADITHGGDRAFYNYAEDYIRLPKYESFKSPSGYYATAFHELGHWSGHKERLDRQIANRFGDQGYSAEELVAELTSAFIGAELGLPNEGLEGSNHSNHASYIKHWIKFLGDNEKAIVQAASQASKAAAFLHDPKGYVKQKEETKELEAA